MIFREATDRGDRQVVGRSHDQRREWPVALGWEVDIGRQTRAVSAGHRNLNHPVACHRTVKFAQGYNAGTGAAVAATAGGEKGREKQQQPVQNLHDSPPRKEQGMEALRFGRQIDSAPSNLMDQRPERPRSAPS
jgi:hypothetical protein